MDKKGKLDSFGSYWIEAQSAAGTLDPGSRDRRSRGSKVVEHPVQETTRRDRFSAEQTIGRVDTIEPVMKVVSNRKPKLTLIGVRLDPFITVLFEKENRLGHIRKIATSDYYARDVLSVPAELLSLEFLVENCSKIEDIRFIQRFLESRGKKISSADLHATA